MRSFHKTFTNQILIVEYINRFRDIFSSLAYYVVRCSMTKYMNKVEEWSNKKKISSGVYELTTFFLVNVSSDDDFKNFFSKPSRLGLINTPTASLHRFKTLAKSALDITINIPIVSLQLCWRFGESGVAFRCHGSKIYSNSGVIEPDRIRSMGQIYELFDSETESKEMT